MSPQKVPCAIVDEVVEKPQQEKKGVYADRLACGDSNADGVVNISDAVYLIGYIFIGGASSPGDCSPGSSHWIGKDCCPFIP